MQTQKEVIRALGQDAILLISPLKISKTVDSKYPVNAGFQRIFNVFPRFVRKFPKYYLRNTHPFVIPGDKYGEAIEIEENNKYKKIRDFIENMERVEESIWFAELVNQLHINKVAKHKRKLMKNKEEILYFLNNYVFDLIHSMRNFGYISSKAQDYSTVLIGPSGDLHKSGSGNHRFNVARLVGVEKYPVKVMGVHQAFLERNKINIKDLDFITSFRALLTQIERDYSSSP